MERTDRISNRNGFLLGIATVLLLIAVALLAMNLGEKISLRAEVASLKQENAGLRNYTASALPFANDHNLSNEEVALMVLAFGQSESCSVLGDSCAGVLADDGMHTVPFVTRARLGNLWFSIVSANRMEGGRIEPRLTVYYDDRRSDHILRTAGDGWVEVIGGGTITRRKIPGEVEKIHRLALAALRS
ncbi:MAG: hypothetical protein KBD16_00470 [Candidatus Pacebacteria bacterium]|nr:hypothetical protein [Candidatus Paceibacterota bacterium]